MYQILSSNSAGALCLEVNEFIKQHTNYQTLGGPTKFYELIGGPYSDGQYHYQAVFIKTQQLND